MLIEFKHGFGKPPMTIGYIAFGPEVGVGQISCECGRNLLVNVTGKHKCPCGREYDVDSL